MADPLCRSASSVTTESEHERKQEQFAAAEAFETLRQEQQEQAVVLAAMRETEADMTRSPSASSRLEQASGASRSPDLLGVSSKGMPALLSGLKVAAAAPAAEQTSADTARANEGAFAMGEAAAHERELTRAAESAAVEQGQVEERAALGHVAVNEDSGTCTNCTALQTTRSEEKRAKGQKEQDVALERLEGSVMALSDSLLRLAHVCVEKTRRSTELNRLLSELSKGAASQTVTGVKSVLDELAQLQSMLVDQTQAMEQEFVWLIAHVSNVATRQQNEVSTLATGAEGGKKEEDSTKNQELTHGGTSRPAGQNSKHGSEEEESLEEEADHFLRPPAQATSSASSAHQGEAEQQTAAGHAASEPPQMPVETNNEISKLLEQLPSPESENLLAALAADQSLNYHLLQLVLAGDQEGAGGEGDGDALAEIVNSLVSESSLLLEVNRTKKHALRLPAADKISRSLCVHSRPGNKSPLVKE